MLASVASLFIALCLSGIRPRASYLLSLSLVSFAAMLLDKMAAVSGRTSLTARGPLVELSEGGLSARVRGGAWGGARAGKGLRGEGRAFFEVEITDCGAAGLCRVGWATAGASLDVGADGGGFGFCGSGTRAHGGSFSPYGGGFARGDVVGCFLEAGPAGAAIEFSVNGAPLGKAFALPALTPTRALYPAVCLRDAALRVNFGGRKRAAKFAFPPARAGFTAVDDLRKNAAEAPGGRPRRVPEDALHALNALGGTPGIVAGMLLLGHKRSCEKAGGARSEWFWGKEGARWRAFFPAAAASCAVHLLLLLLR